MMLTLFTTQKKMNVMNEIAINYYDIPGMLLIIIGMSVLLTLLILDDGVDTKYFKNSNNRYKYPKK